MSSLYSDPPFGRGTTLLNGEAIEYSPPGSVYNATNDSGAQYTVAGREIVGQIKAFLDINPSTKQRLSSELVYCIAARYKPTNGATLTVPTGKGVVLKVGQYLETASFDENLATAANVIEGKRVGFIDEYLPTSAVIRPDDIVWVVFKGPAAVKKTEHASTASIAAGVTVAMSSTAGSVFTKAANNILTVATNEASSAALGLCWGDISDDLATVAFGVAATSADKYARVNLTGLNWTV
jgi:hypothetical protein